MPRGGARPGAGRPRQATNKRTSRSYRLDRRTIETIEQVAEDANKSHAAIIDEWATGVQWNREAVTEARQLLAHAVNIDRKANVSREAIRQAISLLERIQ